MIRCVVLTHKGDVYIDSYVNFVFYVVHS